MRSKLETGSAALLSLLLIANTTPDAFDRVVADLVSGSAAERSGRVDVMLAAATALFREGATPLGDSPDVAVRWQGRGQATTRKPPAEIAPYRERALGAGYRLIALPSGAATQFDQTFLAGQRARVAVVPLTGAEFGLSVRDDQGQSACVRPASPARCDWVPNWTTRYEIRLSNPGKTESNYYIVMR